jgi:hypothetical protein
MVPSRPPSWLAPLSLITMNTVFSNCPMRSSVDTNRPMASSVCVIIAANAAW